MYQSNPMTQQSITKQCVYGCLLCIGWWYLCKDCTATILQSLISVYNQKQPFTQHLHSKHCSVFKACRISLCQTSVCSPQSVWSPVGFVIATFHLQIYERHFPQKQIYLHHWDNNNSAPHMFVMLWHIHLQWSHKQYRKYMMWKQICGWSQIDLNITT